MNVARAPKHLRPATRKWWAAVLDGWELEEHHQRLLTLAGEAWDRAVECRETIGKDGLTVVNRHGEIRPHPLLSVERDSAIRYARLVRELGLDLEPPKESRTPRMFAARG